MRGHRIKAVGKVHEILKLLRWQCKYTKKSFNKSDLVRHVMAVEDLYDSKKILTKYPLSDMKDLYVKFDNELRRLNIGTLDDTLLEANKHLEHKNIVKE